MKFRHHRSLIGVLAVGIVGIFAIGASSASAAVNTTSTTTLGIRAFVDNGFQGSLVGVPGAAVVESCEGGTGILNLVGTASNGMAKSNYNDEVNNEETQSSDDLDNTDFILLNDGGGIGTEVTGHTEFVNGAQTRTLTVQYSTEDGPPNSTADCAVWGTAVKGLF
jgi:hypothetical protein